MSANASWAATITAADGRVTMRFTTPLRAIGLTPEGARQLACKLLLLAESAENEHSRFRDREVPHVATELCRSGCGREVALAELCDACIHGGSHVGS